MQGIKGTGSQKQRSQEYWAGLAPEVRKARGKRNRLLTRYRVTLEWYDAKVKEQNGLCAICGNPPKQRNLSVDHDHACCDGTRACGKCNRGLICENCNTAIERLESIPNWPEKALAYLAHYAQRTRSLGASAGPSDTTRGNESIREAEFSLVLGTEAAS